ncbi:MAG: metal-dependent hydrolase [Candidatus Binatia bacterium]
MAGVTATWLGHSTFLIETPEGKRLLVDPWVGGNPACPDELKALQALDLMVITHGHFDHIGDAVTIAERHEPRIVGIFETCHWLERKGAENCTSMNKGGSVQLLGVRITMVHADHSCGITEDDGSLVYGGEAVGYVFAFSDGTKLYHAGDTNVFGDMGLIRELYQPEVVMLPIGDLYTMSPREAVKACELLKPRIVIPMHYGTFPALTGNPEEFRSLAAELPFEIRELSPGETTTF